MLLYILHLTYSTAVRNDPQVPKRYHIPTSTDNLNGFWLLFLEEMELRRQSEPPRVPKSHFQSEESDGSEIEMVD